MPLCENAIRSCRSALQALFPAQRLGEVPGKMNAAQTLAHCGRPLL